MLSVRVRRKSFRLVDTENIVVLVKNIERNIRRFDGRRAGIFRFEFENVAFFEKSSDGRRFSVDGYAVFGSLQRAYL